MTSLKTNRFIRFCFDKFYQYLLKQISINLNKLGHISFLKRINHYFIKLVFILLSETINSFRKFNKNSNNF